MEAFWKLAENPANEARTNGVDLTKFELENQNVRLFPCPQPGHPEAWALLTEEDFGKEMEARNGRDDALYPEHPLEKEREKAWAAQLDHLGADYKPWEVGQPLLQLTKGYLLDPSGAQLGEPLWMSNTAVADFTGDGMLDVLKAGHFKVTRGEVEMELDGISIGPVSDSVPRAAMLFFNLDTPRQHPLRDWRFSIRRGKSGIFEVVLVPETDEAKEVRFGFREGKFGVLEGAVPAGIYIDAAPVKEKQPGEDGLTFLDHLGLFLNGGGYDPVDELYADDHRPTSLPAGMPRLNWPAGNPGSTTPREAAQQIASACFDPYYQPFYEIASVEAAVPPAKGGWISRLAEGGWSPLAGQTWWLKAGKVECWEWTEKEDAPFFQVSAVTAPEMGFRVATLHELDRVRTVARQPRPPHDPHNRDGGDDITIVQVTVHSESPAPLATVFESTSPSLWHQVGSCYDRELSAYLAAEWTTTFETGTDPQVKTMKDLAPQWLDSATVRTIPAPLSCAVIKAIGVQGWEEFKPLLTKLQDSLEPMSEIEQRWKKLDTDLRTPSHNAESSLMTRSLERSESRDLEAKLDGTPVHALREAIGGALAALEEKAKSDGGK